MMPGEAVIEREKRFERSKRSARVWPIRTSPSTIHLAAMNLDIVDYHIAPLRSTAQ